MHGPDTILKFIFTLSDHEKSEYINPHNSDTAVICTFYATDSRLFSRVLQKRRNFHFFFLKPNTMVLQNHLLIVLLASACVFDTTNSFDWRKWFWFFFILQVLCGLKIYNSLNTIEFYWRVFIHNKIDKIQTKFIKQKVSSTRKIVQGSLGMCVCFCLYLFLCWKMCVIGNQMMTQIPIAHFLIDLKKMILWIKLCLGAPIIIIIYQTDETVIYHW